jgi:hypothetical protein
VGDEVHDEVEDTPNSRFNPTRVNRFSRVNARRTNVRYTLPDIDP